MRSRSTMRGVRGVRGCRRAAAALAAALVGFSAVATAAIIPPDDLFFAPTSLVEAVYPRKAFFGEGAGFSPWTLSWTVGDIVSVDPGRVEVTITGVHILPVLKSNPNAISEEGEYTEAELAAITVANYTTYYKFKPGTNVFQPAVDYGADLTGNVLVVQIDAPGPWTFRVNTTSRPFAGGPLESKSYIWSVLLGDQYAILPGSPPIPTHVQREISVDDVFGEGGVAGPPGTVHVVSEDRTDNGAMTNAFDTLTGKGKDPQKADNIADLVTEVCEAVAANGGNPVKLKLYAHGNGPGGDGGSGLLKIGTQYVCCGDGCTKKAKALGECLKGKVSEIELWSCYTGSDGTFLQQLANAAGVTVGAFDVALTCGVGYFDTSATAKKEKKANQACVESPCVGDLDVNDTVNGGDLGIMLGNWAGSGCGDLNDDGIVNGSDLGVLLGAWGPCPSGAPPQCGPGAGACCTSNGGAGCADEGCCVSVCGLDPACCEIGWDEQCAAMATSLINCACPSQPVCGGGTNERVLVAGYWLLVIGYWSLVVECW